MRGFLKGLLWTVGILGVILFVLYLTLFDVWRIPSDDPVVNVAIQPTLGAGDLLIISRRSTAERADLVRCPDPRAPGRFVIGRVIGKPGEKVGIDGETVNIDGHRNPSPRACPDMKLIDPTTNDEVELSCSVEDLGTEYQALRGKMRLEQPTHVDVSTGYYLVSDNRHMHDDSRDFGQISPQSCQHILVRLWSKDGVTDSKRRFSVLW